MRRADRHRALAFATMAPCSTALALALIPAPNTSYNQLFGVAQTLDTTRDFHSYDDSDHLQGDDLLREEICENITVPSSSAGSQREHGCNRRYRALPSGRPSVLLSADSSWDFEFLLFHLEPGIWILRDPPGPRGLIQRCVRFPGPEWLRKFFNQRNVGCPAIL